MLLNMLIFKCAENKKVVKNIMKFISKLKIAYNELHLEADDKNVHSSETK